MGLFDSLVTSRFPGQDDGSSADGLLAQLTRSFMAQNGNNAPAPNAGQPAPFPGSPPIAQADPAAIPQQAQPAIGQQLPQQAQPQAQLPDFLSPNGGSGGGLGDHLMAGMNNFANAGGLLPALAGGITGLLSGQRTDPQGLQQQTQRATFESLKSAGVPPNLAFAATMNPDILKTIAPAYFDTAPKLTETGTDPFTGQKTFGEYRPGHGMTSVATPGAQGAPGVQTTGAFGEAVKNGVTGEELYQHLPPQMANTVKAMIEGRMAPPSTIAMRSPQTMALINAANAIDPTFDATSWGKRAASAKDYGSGKSAEMVRSANQTIRHVGSLLDSMDDLHNGQYPMLNSVGNYIDSARGKAAPGVFMTNAHAVAEEMSKVFKGANMSDAEIRAWEHNLSPNMSPEQQRGQVAKLMELLHGSLQALEEKRIDGMGPMAAQKAGPLIKEDAQKILQRVDAWVKSNGEASAKASAEIKPLAAGQSTTINGVTIKRVN